MKAEEKREKELPFTRTYTLVAWTAWYEKLPLVTASSNIDKYDSMKLHYIRYLQPPVERSPHAVNATTNTHESLEEIHIHSKRRNRSEESGGRIRMAEHNYYTA